MTDLAVPARGHKRPDLRRGELYLVGSVVVFVGGFAIVSAFVGGERVLANFGSIGWPAILLVLACSLLNYTLRAIRWLIYSKRLGVELPVWNNLLYYFAGFSLTATPAKLGETLRHWLLERGHGYSYSRTLPLWVADRLNDVTATLALILIGLAAFSDLLVTVFGFAVLFTAFMVLIARPGAVLAGIAWLYGQFRVRARFFAGFRRAVRFSATLFSPRLYAIGVALAMVGWFAECVAFHWLLAEMDSSIPLLQATFIFTFALLAGGVSLMPGGIGGFEGSMVGLLLAVDVEPDVAIAATVAIRAATLWFCVLLGFTALPFALHRVRHPVGRDEQRRRARNRRPPGRGGS